MIFQAVELTRLVIILVMHTFISLFLYYLSFKILKRNFNRITLTLSLFYILPGSGFLLSIIFLLFSKNLIGYIIYLTAAFIILFGFIFLILSIKNIVNIDSDLSLKKDYIIIFVYGISIFFLFCIPGAITINENTKWVPLFSWQFLIYIYLFFTITIFMPTLILSIKLYNTFEDKRLKRKLKFFFIGIIGMFSAFYGLILYNTWHDPFFRTIWAFIVFLIVVPSGFLIYYGIGQNI